MDESTKASLLHGEFKFDPAELTIDERMMLVERIMSACLPALSDFGSFRRPDDAFFGYPIPLPPSKSLNTHIRRVSDSIPVGSPNISYALFITRSGEFFQVFYRGEVPDETDSIGFWDSSGLRILIGRQPSIVSNLCSNLMGAARKGIESSQKKMQRLNSVLATLESMPL